VAVGDWTCEPDLVDGARRRQLAQEALDGYASGTDAPIAATTAALARAETARSVVLVEGISDQIALETLAQRNGRDLAVEGIAIVPIGGAQAAPRFLRRFSRPDAAVAVSGLCDVGEERFFQHGMEAAGLGTPGSRQEMERLGFFVCINDLEEELIRAAGQTTIEPLLESQGDLGSFRTLQKQPAWRDEPFEAQMHRWLRAGARRNLRYARLLVLALDLARTPSPLSSVLAAA
jgi:hypothetical protein